MVVGVYPKRTDLYLKKITQEICKQNNCCKAGEDDDKDDRDLAGDEF